MCHRNPRNVWTADEAHEKVHYIHGNPVGRGLVDGPGDWPWSSWRGWQFGIDPPIRRAEPALRLET